MIIERHICDLCWFEDKKVRLAGHQYTAPYLKGLWMDGCKKHTDEMRVAGGHKFKRVQNPNPDDDEPRGDVE